MASGCYIVDKDYNVVSINETAKSIYPQLEVGKKCYRCLLNLDKPCGPCPVQANRKGPSLYTDPIRNISETVDSVEVEIEGHGKCHALIFSTVGSDEQFAATLPVTSEGLRNLSLIKALGADYEDVFSVNLTSGTISLYRHENKPVDTNSIYRSIVSYQKGIEDYANKYVYHEDKETFLLQNNLKYIKEELTYKESFRTHYRVVINDEIHHYYRKIVRIGKDASFEHVVIGVRCEDDQVRSLQNQLTLERKLSDIKYSSLTGLYTKEAFIMQSAELLKTHPNTEYDFCISKVDNLDSISRQYGNLAIENTLALIGKLLKNHEDDDNCIGYFGEGTFASFTKNDPPDIRKAAVMAFKEDVLEKSEIKNISLKWAIYTNVQRNLSVAQIYRKTSYALSTIRLNRNQCYVEFDQSMIERMEKEEMIVEGFESALKSGEFVAWYQPKYSVKTGKIVGGEALTRWIQSDGSVVSPQEFIPILEEHGKIHLLDEYIFRQVCSFQAIIKKMGFTSIPISVNLSRASMFRNNLADIYSNIADEYSVDKKDIPIEITESAAVRATTISTFADHLIQKGFILHMDDFGVGYSSLGSLAMIPFETIKIDKSLIDHIGTSVNENLLKHTIAFAKECGKTTVAEGVDTLEKYQFLKEVGCDMIQGFYFSKPVNEKDFVAKLLAEK